MKLPLFQALLDIQKLNGLYPNLVFTQTIQLPIENNRLKLPVASKITVLSGKAPDDFYMKLEHVLSIYEEYVDAAVIDNGTSQQMTYSGEIDPYYFGIDDESNRSYLLKLKIDNNGITTGPLLPINGKANSKYTPIIAKQLKQAIQHYNQIMA